MNVAEMLAEALTHHRSGQLAQAEAMYRQVLSIEPYNAEALHMLGVIAYQAGNLEAALDLIGQSIDCSPGEAAYFNNLGEVLRAIGEPREAIIALRQAVALKGGIGAATAADSDLLGNLGAALLDTDEITDAEAILRRAVKLDPNRFKPHLYLARLLQKKGNEFIDPAIHEAELAVSLSKGQNIETIVTLANLFQCAGRFSEAQAQAERAIVLSASSWMAHSALGSALLAQGRFDEASEAFSAALELNPDHAPAHFGLGQAFDNAGRVGEALASFERALAIDHQDHRVHAGMAAALAKTSDHTRAAAHWRWALELKGDDPQYLRQLTAALEKLGELEEAALLRQRADQLDSPH